MASFDKTYQQKPQGAIRDEISRLYTNMRVKRPIETIRRSGDLCAASVTERLSTLTFGGPLSGRTRARGRFSGGRGG